MGRVHVTIGEPLGLGTTLAEDDSVPKVAFEICHRINRVTPVTPTSIVAMAMLGAEGRGLTLQEGREIVLPILEFLDRRNLPVTAEVRLGDVGPLREALSALVGQGVVEEYPGGVESVYAIDPAKQPEVAFYRNASIHFFITRAIVELALLHAAEANAEDLEDAVWKEALRLRDLLKFEFFFARKREFAEEVRAEVELMAPGWESRSTTAGEVEGYLRDQPLLLAPRVLRPFVEAYRVVADELARRTPPEPTDEKRFLADCVQVALQQQARGRLVARESVSKELFGGALRLAANRGLDDAESRHAFARETADVDRRLGVIVQMARRLIPNADPAWATSSD
jgi:glycerol-3-phosphate O-acyltransferase